ALGEAPDWLCLPVGNAGNITAYWMGFTEYLEDGLIRSRPRLLGAQAAGAAPIVRGHVVEKPETIATAIRIGNPVRWQQALAALSESNGHITDVTDEEILHWYRMVAQTEGVFVEPACASSLAAIAKGRREGWLDLRGKRVVCVMTGHGLKDPDTALSGLPAPITIQPQIEALLDVLQVR
ncbi:MAG: pyridoxal-phosphate dependent enzyme, partial [Anaerolineae bacterium]|nr:pyridoxal-phosphate dependent enzyme [Anaerolineae bacterium]